MNSSGISSRLTSRLVPKHYLKNDPIDVADTIERGLEYFPEGADLRLTVLFTPPATIPNTGKTSIHPVWYDSLWHVIFSARWTSTTSESDTQSIVDAVYNAGQVLRKFTPDSGAYLNEVRLLSKSMASVNYLSIRGIRTKLITSSHSGVPTTNVS